MTQGTTISPQHQALGEMPGVRQTRHVRWFAGPPATLALGEPTTTTASLGRAVVCGRPYALDGPVSLDPDGPVPALRRALRSLDGKFSLLAAGTSTAVFATDALGCGPAYYAERNGSVFVASQLGPLVRLLEGGVTLDPVGSAAAVAGSVSVGGRTPYDGVHRLQAGQFALIDLASGRIQVESYGSVEEIFGVDHEAPGCPDEVMELIRAAVAREVGIDGLFLTAGKDSRILATALTQEQRDRTLALTYGGWRSVDRRGSGDVAASIGFQHRLIGPLRLRPEQYADPIIVRGGGSSGLQVAQHVAGARVARQHATVVMTGFLGDILSGNPFRPEPERVDRHVWIRHTPRLKRSGGVDPAAVLLDELAVVREELRQGVERHADAPPGRTATIVDLTHRQAGYISGTFDMVGQEVEVATPFFNRHLIRYFLTRRAVDLTGSQLYERTLEAAVGSVPPPSGATARLARAVAARRRDYDTVNWPAVLKRSRPWLRTLLEGAPDLPLTRLALDSLDTEARLPLALFAVPILDTLRAAWPTEPPASDAADLRESIV